MESDMEHAPTKAANFISRRFFAPVQLRNGLRVAAGRGGVFATNAIKLDDTNRIRLGMLPLGDYSEPDVLSADEIRLKKVPTPEARKRMTFTEAMRAIETRDLRFTTSWDELRKETRE